MATPTKPPAPALRRQSQYICTSIKCYERCNRAKRIMCFARSGFSYETPYGFHTLQVRSIDETHTPPDVFDVFEYMGGVNGSNLLGQTAAYTVGKHQRKWLCRAADSPPSDRSKTSCHSPPPTKSVHVDFKNACARNPPVRTRKNMRSTRRPILYTTVRIFRGSAAPSSP
jgi:hypothetical protein